MKIIRVTLLLLSYRRQYAAKVSRVEPRNTRQLGAATLRQRFRRFLLENASSRSHDSGSTKRLAGTILGKLTAVHKFNEGASIGGTAVHSHVHSDM